MPNNLIDAEANRLLDLSLADGDLLCLMAATGVEVVGGGYARQVLDWAAATGRRKANAASVSFTGMPATDVQGWEVRSATDVPKWAGLLDARFGSAAAATNTITTTTAHGLADDDRIVFSGLSGVAAGVYFARNVQPTTLQIAYAAGGPALDITVDSLSVALGRVYTTIDGGGFTLPAGQISCSLA